MAYRVMADGVEIDWSGVDVMVDGQLAGAVYVNGEKVWPTEPPVTTSQAVYAVDLSGLVGGAPSAVVTWPVDGTFGDRVGLGMSITQPSGMTFGADGVLYVADSNKLYRFDGTQSEVSTGISSVSRIAYGDGVFYIADISAKKVYSWDGTTTTQIASAVASPFNIAFGDGLLYISDQFAKKVYSWDGTTTTQIASAVASPSTLAFGNGLLYILDVPNSIVYSWDGTVATPVTTGQFVSIAEDDNGVIYLCNASYVLNIYENENMTSVAASGISAGHPISLVAVGPAQT